LYCTENPQIAHCADVTEGRDKERVYKPRDDAMLAGGPIQIGLRSLIKMSTGLYKRRNFSFRSESGRLESIYFNSHSYCNAKILRRVTFRLIWFCMPYAARM